MTPVGAIPEGSQKLWVGEGIPQLMQLMQNTRTLVLEPLE